MATIINTSRIKRLFIACPIESPEVRGQLWATRERMSNLLPSVDFQWEENPHVTVRFIGAVNLDDEDVETHVAALRDGLHTIADRSLEFGVQVGQLDTFPGVLWHSVAGTAMETRRLAYMFKRVDRLARACFFPAAYYPPRPHITVGRFDQERQAEVNAAIGQMDPPKLTPLTLEKLVLMESVRWEDGEVEYRPAFSDATWEFGK